MARAFYHYTLTVLEKVSFDPGLFKKELEKAYQSLLPHERMELKIWLKKFLIKHPELKLYLQQSEHFDGQKLIKAS
jgi:hypothetical protein